MTVAALSRGVGVGIRGSGGGSIAMPAEEYSHVARAMRRVRRRWSSVAYRRARRARYAAAMVVAASSGGGVSGGEVGGDGGGGSGGGGGRRGGGEVGGDGGGLCGGCGRMGALRCCGGGDRGRLVCRWCWLLLPASVGRLRLGGAVWMVGGLPLAPPPHVQGRSSEMRNPSHMRLAAKLWGPEYLWELTAARHR